MSSPSRSAASRRRSGRKFWLKQLHQWHWISSAMALVGLLLFAVTGFTLNHAADIEGSPKVTQRAGLLPPVLLRMIRPDGAADSKKPFPAPVADWLRTAEKIEPRGNAEWSADEIYLALPQPGGDAWVSVDRSSGKVAYEHTDRGWISYLNDLHKGRNAGTVWFWFIDVFALACLMFALTGLLLLQLHSAERPSTWPLVGIGMAIPGLIAFFFVHRG